VVGWFGYRLMIGGWLWLVMASEYCRKVPQKNPFTGSFHNGILSFTEKMCFHFEKKEEEKKKRRVGEICKIGAGDLSGS